MNFSYDLIMQDDEIPDEGIFANIISCKGLSDSQTRKNKLVTDKGNPKKSHLLAQLKCRNTMTYRDGIEGADLADPNRTKNGAQFTFAKKNILGAINLMQMHCPEEEEEERAKFPIFKKNSLTTNPSVQGVRKKRKIRRTASFTKRKQKCKPKRLHKKRVSEHRSLSY
jgi:hypothetical protein